MKRAVRIAVLLLPVALTVSCGGEAPPSAAAAKPAPKGWVRHDDPRGFALSTPKGWSVDVVEVGAIVARSPDGSQRVLVAPFADPEHRSALEWLSLATQELRPLLPQAEIDRTERLRKKPDERLATVTYRAGHGAEGRADLLVSVDGPAGMLYGVAAPKEHFATSRGEMIRVLDTFVFTEASVAPRRGPAAPAVQYVRVPDRKEGAFSLEVPRDWETHVAMERLSSVDPRPVVRTQSPDGKILIGGGDAELLPFILPDPMLASTGFTEGSTYSPGYGVVMRVMRYMPGARFAKEYVSMRLGDQAPDLEFTAVRDRPDLARRINAIYARYNQGGQMNVQQHFGEVTFTCTLQGKPRRGWYFAGTRLLTMPNGSGNWQFTDLYGYAATPDAVPLAKAVTKHMIDSFRLNPEWLAMQQGLTANVSTIVTQTNAEISKIIQSTYEHTQAVQDDAARKFSNMILGQTDLKDPETGETWKATAGHNYYWRREHTDEVAGTETYDRPDIDFQPLEEW
jgi:hypothetical protein